MSNFFTKNVPFEKIIHNDFPCHVKEGFGNKHISEWPVYDFFCLYRDGNRKEATEKYVSWYEGMLERNGEIPNIKYGGFYKGSLYRMIEGEAGVPYEQVSQDIKRRVIEKRVEERFALLDDIKRDGYKPEIERVDAVKKNGQVCLKGGHHRAVILLALGYTEMPGVLVFSNTFLYNCFLTIRSFKQHVSFRK